MNETLRCLRGRRSIRSFKPQQVTDEELHAVLEAGMYAPSGANQQAALLIVVQDPQTRATLSRMNQAVKPADSDPYHDAPTIILVLADQSKVTPVEDASLALGNMFNAAFSLGLGSCWVHRERQMFASDQGQALLKKWGVEGDYVGVGACVLGYPEGEHPQAGPRKDGYVVMVR
jgi:nitroreductase